MKCSFCKKEIARGTGKQFIQNDGKSMFFCSSKCEKNTLKLRRKPRFTRWTDEAQQLKKEGAKPAEKISRSKGKKLEAEKEKKLKEDAKQKEKKEGETEQ